MTDLATRLAALIAARPCHQCAGTGQQEVGERPDRLRLVDAPPKTETCHLCKGTGTWEPIGVTTADIRVLLDGVENG